MRKNTINFAFVFSGLFLGLGLLIFISLLFHLLGYSIPGKSYFLSLPGAFLFSTFLWASFFVPLYLFALAYLLASSIFRKENLILLTLLILPFVTSSFWLQVVFSSHFLVSPAAGFIVERLGMIFGGIILFLFLLLELLLILKVRSLLYPGLDKPPGGLLLPPAAPENEQHSEELSDSKAPPAIIEPEIELLEEGSTEEPVEMTEVPPSGTAYKEYGLPVEGLLKEYASGEYWQIDDNTKEAAAVLKQTLEEFKIKAEVTGIRKGPVITMFEILPAPGVKISRIANLADNIALRLAASRVRIVAPIPGKQAVGIEVPNRERAIVSFREMIVLESFQKNNFAIPIVLGKDIAGEPQIVDLTQTPHLLIAGATGSGKSVCVNSIICSILYRRSPEEVRFLLIDPKIVELKFYNDIPHLLTPVVTDPRKAFQALQYCITEMERRYSLLDSFGVRDIRSFNRKALKTKTTIGKLPYIVIVVDEFADLMATTGKEMEATLARLAAMSRAVGLHLVLATQRPSIDVITGLIKANIPTRIAFMVASKFDSRIIIDSVGAEKLLGQGDMLFSAAWDPVPVRMQGTYLDEDEVEAITDAAKALGQPDYIDEEIFFDDDGMEDFVAGDSEDPLMGKALEIIITAGKASASYLQRRLKIGYNRAARIIEEMEMRGIVGPANGSKPREILHVPDRTGG